jgi:hypothetical protein
MVLNSRIIDLASAESEIWICELTAKVAPADATDTLEIVFVSNQTHSE